MIFLLMAGLALSPMAFADELPSFDATHCELYVNSFAVAELRYQGVQEKALDVDLMIDDGQLTQEPYASVVRAGAGLNLRVFTAEVGQDGRPFLRVEDRLRVATAIHGFGPNHRVYFPFERRLPVSDTFEEIVDFAFFVDVLRTDGETVRIWQKHDGFLYTMQDVFGDGPASSRSLGIGVLKSPEPSSVIFDFKRRCARG
jgi:hypothetical protein